MKKLTFVTGLFLTLLFNQKGYAQVLYANPSTAFGYSGYDGAMVDQDLSFTTGLSVDGVEMTLQKTDGYLGIGTTNPTQKCTILGGNFNIDGSTASYGYMLANNMYLWNVGDPSSVYCGNNTGIHVTPSSSLNNSVFGDNAGFQLTTGASDTYMGYYAGYSDNQGQFNTLIGSYSGQSLTGSSSSVVAWVGTQTVTVTVPGCFNTMCGTYCGTNVQLGKANCYYGKFAGANNTGINNSGSHIGSPDNSGNYNCMYGIHSGDGFSVYSSDSEAYFGTYTGYRLNNGNDNVMIGSYTGYNAGYNANNPSSYNVLIGGLSAQQYTGGNYSIVLGYEADAYVQTCISCPICTTCPITNAVAIGASAVVHTDNTFILGNNAQSVGIGYSGTYSVLPAKLAVWQNSGTPNTIGEYVTNSDVSNGGPVGSGNPPKPLIGLESHLPAGYSYYNVAGWFESDQFNWRCAYPCVSPTSGYAIFVPQNLVGGLPVNEGTVDIGFQFKLDNPTWLLKVNGSAQINRQIVPSDTAIKKEVLPFKYGLKAIRNFNPVFYHYNGIGGFDTSTNYIGLIAEDVKRNVPPAVVPSFITKDTITYDTATILDIYEEGILYTTVNGVKELDSLHTSDSNTWWKTKGNIGTTPTANFVGTKDSMGLMFKTHGVQSGYLDMQNMNTSFGRFSLVGNTSGNTNCAYGQWSLNANNNGNLNNGYGNQSLLSNVWGNNNNAMGYRSLWDLNGQSNDISIGAGSRANGFSNSVGIGDSTTFTLANQIYFQDRLRNWNIAGVPYQMPTTQGASNTVLTDNGAGVLTWQPAGGTGFASCSGPASTLTNSSALSLNHKNIYFQGNNSDTLNQNAVGIGYNCGNNLPGKLSVWQNSSYNPATATQSSIGAYIENDDLQYGSTLGGQPVYGVYSTVPASGTNHSSVAGYFNAPGNTYNYALIVPSGGGNVGIGTTSPNSNLEVDGTVYNSGTTFITLNSATSNIALYSNAAQAISYSPEYGILGSASNAQTVGMMNVGVYGGGFGSISGVTNVGVYGYGNNNSYTDYGGYFVGNVYTTGGSVSGSGYLYASDSAIKTQVNSFPNAMALINKLKPRTYYFNRQNPYHMTLDTFKHYGFIAQDVQRVIPCMVHTVITPPQVDSSRKIIAKSDTFKALDYNQITPLLAQGLQEHQQTIDSLRAALKAQQQKTDSLGNVVQGMQSCLAQLCQNQNNGHKSDKRGSSGDSNDITNIQNVTLYGNAPRLWQSQPNPMDSRGTQIKYFLPEGTTGAIILFTDNNGNQIKEVPLNQTGLGIINITPENLSSGIYLYSLIINGKVADTKRMELQK